MFQIFSMSDLAQKLTVYKVYLHSPFKVLSYDDLLTLKPLPSENT